MEHFKQSLVLAATPAVVYAALTTPTGLHGWWSEDCEVNMQIGGTLLFRFGPNHKEMRVEQLEPGRRVQWRCVAAHIDALTKKDEWVGTQLVFDLSLAENGGTRLDFEHIGLIPAFECYNLCNGGWQHFLASLKQYAETGRGTPWVKNAVTEEWNESLGEHAA